MKIKINWKKFGICCAVAAAVAVGTAFARGIAGTEDAKTFFMFLSDAFFVSGDMMLIAGGLVWTADRGVADGLGYGMSRLFRRHGTKFEEKQETYSEYRERKHAKKTQVLEIILCGILMLSAALILLLPYSFQD